MTAVQVQPARRSTVRRLGIRRTTLPWPARVLAPGVPAALAVGVGVVGLKLLAHG